MRTIPRFSVLGLLFCAPTAAATAPVSALYPSQPTPGLATQVEVIFVGQVAKETTLAASIGELLSGRGATMTAERVDVLEEAEVLSTRRGEGSSRIRIWITVPHAAAVRIWFAAPSLDRFLSRDVALSNGFDAVGAEQIAQIVQSSAEALHHGELGVTRSVAQRLWREQQRQKPLRDVSTQREASPGTVEQAREPGTLQATFRDGRVVPRGSEPVQQPRSPKPWIGLGYGVARNAAELEWLHGPVIALGVNYALLRGTVGVHLAGEWHLPQRFTGEFARVELQSKTGWLMLLWSGQRDSQVALAGSLGFGVEFTQVQPMAKEATGFSARPAYTDRSYLTRLRGGPQGKLGWFGWMVSVGIDLSLSRTSYGVDTEQGYSPFLRLWNVRPGMELGAWFE